MTKLQNCGFEIWSSGSGVGSGCLVRLHLRPRMDVLASLSLMCFDENEVGKDLLSILL